MNILVISLFTVLFSFAMPLQASAFDLGSLFGTSNSSNYNYSYIDAQHQGDIKINKYVRDTSKGSGFKESITVRSGALVEVYIVVKNTSSKYDGDVYITDEINGSSVYVPSSLSVQGGTSSGSLTSGGLRVFMNHKSEISILYKIRVCSDYGSPSRSVAYSAGIGSAQDATTIVTERIENSYSDLTGTCLSSFQTNNNYNSSNNYSTNNPFGSWTGVNSNTSQSTSTNPFGDWTGVNSNTSYSTSSQSTSTNPFGDWTGVNNSNSSQSYVAAQNNSSVSNQNPFGDWTGVNNFDSASSQNTNSSTNSTNPFGDWTGVNNSNDSQNFVSYNSQGYATTSNTSNPFGDWAGENNTVSSSPASTTYRVAPRTGVDKAIPFLFASLATLGFLAYRKRKLLFS
jgi:hypothetical protein